MRQSLTVSAVLHLIGLIVLIFGLPHFAPPLPAPPRIIPVDIVEVGEITQSRRVDEPTPTEEKKIEEPAPPQKEQAKPEEKPPEPLPPPKTPEKPKEELAELLKKLKEPKKPVEEKPAPDRLQNLLKDLAKKKDQPKPDAPAEEKPKADAAPSPATPNLADRLTISEEDLLRRQISQCWNMPIGAKDAGNLVVELVIDVNADRTVARAEIVDKGRMSSDTYFRAAAEAALRAVNNPRCSPLMLPEGKYEQWKRIRFSFDPRDML
jgi:outer membrane biosynthesis protein TonB